MENAVDALKMAFAVMVFVMALSLAIYMFSQARETADIVLHSSDVTQYMSYEQVATGSEKRIVGLESIVPTLYKYYKENYTVIFRNSNGTALELYTTKTDPDTWDEKINKYYPGNDIRICSFDVNEETNRHEPWTASADLYKQNIDMFLSGGTIKFSNGVEYKYKGFMNKYKNATFIEDLGEYTYNATNDKENSNSTIKAKKKRVIIYTEYVPK